MKALLPLFALSIVLAAPVRAETAAAEDNLLVTALRLRLNSVAPVVIDPDVLDLKLLTTDIRVEAKDRASAVSQLKSQLEPRGLSVYDQNGVVWVTKSDAEPDLSRQIALVVNSKNYQQLAGQLVGQARANPDSRLTKLAEMAKFMADQSRIPADTRNLIEEKTKKIKSLQFMQKNALTGSALTPPDPDRAAGLELDIEKERNDIREYYARIEDHFLASAFDAKNPASAPPAVYATQGVLPPVLFNRVALDSELFYVESMEALLRASTSLAFAKADQTDTAKLRSRIDAIKKMQILVKKDLDQYVTLLERAGLVTGAASQKGSSSSSIGVEAANKLFNVIGDKREAVRVAIGKNIMDDLERVARRLRDSDTQFLLASTPSQLYLFGTKEIETATTALGLLKLPLSAYNAASHERLGAVTGLTVRASGFGSVSTFSVQLEPVAGSVSKERSIQNIFGNSEKVVSINTAADLALLDGILLGKEGSLVDTTKAALGEGGMIGSVGEALDLIKNEYDPALFRSRISLSFDQNFEIAYSGDSAGVAIALAALSRVKAKPVDSRLAVTGAVRQFGDVRPVGGIYAKGSAALEAGALTLLMPLSNLGEMLNLPVDKIITRHFVSLERFKDAAVISRVVVAQDGQAALEGLCLYNYAVAALGNGMKVDALALCRKAAAVYPNHISAQVLAALLSAAGVKASTSEKASSLALQAQSFANQMTTNQVDISRGYTSADTADPADAVMVAIIPDFTVAGITIEEAFAQLNDKARAASGQSPNINIRKKNPFFKNSANLSIQNKTVLEILKELCGLCEATFERMGSAIVVDSLQSPIPADVSALVIPDYTVSNMNPEEAFKLLAKKAEEASGKKVNITIESHENIWTDLAISLSMQRKSFKEIIDQLCAICDATVEQRGDSFVIKVVK